MRTHRKRHIEKILLCHNSHLTMADGPAIKPWCKDDKNRLQKLIDDSVAVVDAAYSAVDITKTDDIKYINFVRHKYFQEQESINFHCNF